MTNKKPKKTQEKPDHTDKYIWRLGDLKVVEPKPTTPTKKGK